MTSFHYSLNPNFRLYYFSKKYLFYYNHHEENTPQCGYFRVCLLSNDVRSIRKNLPQAVVLYPVESRRKLEILARNLDLGFPRLWIIFDRPIIKVEFL